jgi:hypothetical protein
MKTTERENVKRIGKRSCDVRYDISQKAMEEIHIHGASQFRAAWLHANEAVAQHASSRTNVSDPAMRELLSFVTLRILMRLNVEGIISFPNPGTETK